MCCLDSEGCVQDCWALGALGVHNRTDKTMNPSRISLGNLQSQMRAEVFMAVKIRTVVFSVMTPCSLP